ncbi:MAG: LysM peptidoglycan-binding domain-containing protein [Gammaproteobacteria bacterium]|nr:LysM peptidoglycan-binding domain-containing protein [Gammaproteobacteria bacterium]
MIAKIVFHWQLVFIMAVVLSVASGPGIATAADAPTDSPVTTPTAAAATPASNEPSTVFPEPELAAPTPASTPAAETPSPLPTSTTPDNSAKPPESAVQVRDGVANRYVVKKGDTLWGIAAHFLKDPWLWPEVWQVNPKIRNPHLIYPGDVIALHYVDGKPVLVLEGTELPKGKSVPPPAAGRSELPLVKLTPHARVEKLSKAINSLPKDAIAAFLSRPYLLGEDTLDQAPYIVSSMEEHLATSNGARVYATGLEHTTVGSFAVVRAGQRYEDPETGEFLGQEGVYLSEATLVKIGSPSTLVINKGRQEVIDGDYLVPIEKTELDVNFFPRLPRQKISGQIISVYQGVSRIGQYNMVVINRGEEQGLEAGHILEVYQSGIQVRDPHGAFFSGKITLPDERAGVLMVIRAYRKLSFALVMEAEREMRVFDRVANP